jgi:GNAT superfamily N-acetyltransferase
MPDDAAALARLITQLGYPSTAEQVATRLTAMSSDYKTIVTEEDGVVTGMAGGMIALFVHCDGAYGRITALVVDQTMRGRGLGRALAAAIESWFIERGVTQVRVTSGLHREEAHRFYERLGYERTGFNYSKTL